MDRHRIGIVIPALNEAATIGAVVTNASQYGKPIVVDDGSSDETGHIAKNAGAIVVRHDSNCGYDQALNSGFECANELECEYVITMDADGQHNPQILSSFIEKLDDGADVVLGHRDRRQRLAEHIFAWVSKVKWGISDPLCGMKAYRIGIYKKLGHFDSYNSIGTELAIYAVKSASKISQVPVLTCNRGDEPRFGKIYSANKRIFLALWLGLISSKI
jgi:glycosyltransferase involved in cell wall biosynthesis